ncbi:hypothetical protein LTS07_009319 [Exophiala sideris]|nr:hypothetical protein LTS07_009319 [Exophiala sideris]
MSYQSFLRATSNSNINSPSPSSIQRKPAAAPNSIAPPPTSPSAHSATTHHATPSTSSNAPRTPVSSINSFPPSKPSTRPVSTPAATLKPLTKAQIDAAMSTCLDVQNTATTYHEKRPFAALLLGPDNMTVLLTHFSISHVQHAETELARLASIHFSQEYLATCTLVSTEEKLNDLTGGDNDENMTMSLPCRDVLKAGQKAVEVIGPVSGWEEKIVEESGKWWKEHSSNESQKLLRDGSINGSERPGSLSSMRQGTPTTWTGEETVSSSINDEGEYKADLDIDWMR